MKRPVKPNPELLSALGTVLKFRSHSPAPTTPEKTAEPKACPFDGFPADLEHDAERQHGWRVVCSCCRASSAWCRRGSYAVALWNRRAP